MICLLSHMQILASKFYIWVFANSECVEDMKLGSSPCMGVYVGAFVGTYVGECGGTYVGGDSKEERCKV